MGSDFFLSPNHKGITPVSYTHLDVYKRQVNGYIKEPEQYNDDITFQLVFLEAFAQSGYRVTSDAIAEEWVARIPMGFTAEGVALRNLKQGISRCV